MRKKVVDACLTSGLLSTLERSGIPASGVFYIVWRFFLACKSLSILSDEETKDYIGREGRYMISETQLVIVSIYMYNKGTTVSDWSRRSVRDF